mmetsp:Transcript_20966/g.54947  ORF Transcript_20966/g.54947 Transcript_20966/m.54947 type:complete len:215 (-) Transcript_20966:958-1602(-)
MLPVELQDLHVRARGARQAGAVRARRVPAAVRQGCAAAERARSQRGALLGERRLPQEHLHCPHQRSDWRGRARSTLHAPLPGPNADGLQAGSRGGTAVHGHRGEDHRGAGHHYRCNLGQRHAPRGRPNSARWNGWAHCDYHPRPPHAAADEGDAGQERVRPPCHDQPVHGRQDLRPRPGPGGCRHRAPGGGPRRRPGGAEGQRGRRVRQHPQQL